MNISDQYKNWIDSLNEKGLDLKNYSFQDINISSYKVEDKIETYTNIPSNKNWFDFELNTDQIISDTSQVGEQGLYASHQIGLTLNELRCLIESKQFETFDNKVIIISGSNSFLFETATTHALKCAIRNLLLSYDKDLGFPKIVIKYNTKYFISKTERNNLIRYNQFCLANLIGGADGFIINESENISSHTINGIKHLIKHELKIDEPQKLMQGSQFLESLSKEILKKSWGFFQSISTTSNKEIITSDAFIKTVEEQCKSEADKVIVGLNKYQSNL